MFSGSRMEGPSKKRGKLRQMRVVPIRPRGTPRDLPPPLPERLPGVEPSAFPEEPVPFASLGLPSAILDALHAMGYSMATEVQARALPLARSGRDLIVQSRTGTGKTTAFGIPVIERTRGDVGEVQALVLCPTRELSLQVTGELGRLSRPSGVRVLTIYGGDSMSRQLEGLRQGAQVVVGTPGRVLDHLRQGTLRLARVRTLVLDEVDQMLDMGFEKEMKQILERVPADRQTLMFSATIPSSIEAIASRYQRDPARLMLSQDYLYVADVQHLFYILSRMDKAAALYKLIEYEAPSSSMIFCNTRAETRTVYNYLAMRGLPVAMISSDLPQKKREQVMQRFRKKELRHLVATDVAARGIDIEDMSHVFIYSAPVSSDQYIHRAGRTGRLGRSGKAISLVSGFDLMNFNRLVRANNLKAYECDIPSDEEVARREVRRIVDTLKEQAARLTPEERAEYEAMARGILDEEERLSIVAYLLKTHFEEEAAKGVLDEPAAPAPDPEAAPRPAHGHERYAPAPGPGAAPGEGSGSR
ncbi:MAG: DEAD/DEAH box helicase, partial [Acidobacteria bacterium]|nr:DEAD/DEAH box helicase [Acidobacteriota bacterium]